VTAVSTFPPRLPRPYVIWTLVRREYASKRTYRLAFLLDILFAVANLLMFFFISRALDVQPGVGLTGAPSYFAFVLVGIALTNVVGAASTGLAYRIREEQFTGTLEALLVQPIRLTELSAGLAMYPFLLAMARAALYILVGGGLLGVAFGGASWLGFAVMLVASALAFAGLGILLGAVVLVVKRGEALVGLLTYALGILGGAFFPIEVLPGWIEALALVAPTRFAFDGVREAIFQGSGWVGDAAVLFAFAAVSIPVANFLFRQAVEYSRREGSLGQY
jgi:ABC-2 type transport system permease protein